MNAKNTNFLLYALHKNWNRSVDCLTSQPFILSISCPHNEILDAIGELRAWVKHGMAREIYY